MKSFVWLGLLLALLAGHAWAATNSGQSVVFIPGVQSGPCSTWPTCPAVPNDSTHPFFVSGTSGSDATKLALDASIQSLITILNAPLSLPTGAATSALQTTANGYLLTLSTFSASASTSALQTSGNATLASMLAAQATAANQSTGNGYLSTLATASASQATGAKQDTGNTSLATIATNSGTQATAANQTNVQSTPGTPQTKAVTIQGNASGVAVPVSGTVTITPSGTQTITGTVGLSAGSAIIGKAGIDQTTPGTTNGVVVNSSALPAGAASASNQTAVQSAPGTPQTSAVTVQGNVAAVPVITGPPKLTAYGTLSVTASSVALSTLTVGPNSPAWSTTYPSNYVSIRNSINSAGVVYVCWLGGTCSASVGDVLAVGQSATRNVGNTVSPTVFAASTATVIGSE